ncbi:MAG TPA: carbon-nitrogen hydrolase family protein [Stellaceae bacterium]|nr:carbon-nitrogen hydrolase family protein [Stellaceae bacterium]
MGDSYQTVKVAAVQAASVFLDREGSTAKACGLIREAGRNGAQVIGFPEGFIPAHPIWYHHHAATGAIANRLAVELFKNAVEIPGPEIDALCAAARDAGAYVVIGVCEKLPRTLGTMFNSQVFIGPDGTYIGKHQKIMPTVGERLVHMGGFGDTLRAFPTSFGPMSGLICGENSNPLAIFAMTAEGSRIHVMSWPNHFPTSGDPMRNRVSIDSQAFAQMSKAFVVSACGTVDEDVIQKLKVGSEGEKFLRSADCCGGSVIVAPNSRIIAGPMGAEEGILYAECNIELGINMKLRHDFAGHYNRPDIFHLQVNRNTPQIYAIADVEEKFALPGAGAPGPALEQRHAVSAPPKQLTAGAARTNSGTRAAPKRTRRKKAH